jgi:hypothetical protein
MVGGCLHKTAREGAGQHRVGQLHGHAKTTVTRGTARATAQCVHSTGGERNVRNSAVGIRCGGISLNPLTVGETSTEPSFFSCSRSLLMLIKTKVPSERAARKEAKNTAITIQQERNEYARESAPRREEPSLHRGSFAQDPARTRCCETVRW